MPPRAVAHVEPSKEIPKKTYTPIGCLVAIHVYPQDKTPAGLLIPERTTNPYQTSRCLVIAVGPDCKYVKEGDEVLVFNPPTGIGHAGYATGLIREDLIAGIVTDEYKAAV